MITRRLIYIALLATAALYHFAYGQYVTHYILIFLLCLPLLSLLVSLPAAFTSRAACTSGSDVQRGGHSSVQLELKCKFFLPPEAWRITICEKNLFTNGGAQRRVIHTAGTNAFRKDFSPDTSHIGTISYSIKKAHIYDYLGLFTLPVHKGGAAYITVLPGKERPMPEPELDDPSSIVLKPMPIGFSEEHELRPYRSGDPMNLVHWKLSSKFDDMIVREPQEVIRKQIVLYADSPGIYEHQQSVLEQLCYLNASLNESQIPYLLIFGENMLKISSGDEFNEFIKSLLDKPMYFRQALGVPYEHNMLVCRVRPSNTEVSC